MDILDQYVASAPGPQNALDVLKGEWTSKLPGELADLRAGSAPLFEDARIKWCVDQFGGIKTKTVLELGPLEGGHTYMLERFGAASVTAIEANTHAYLKCLITKELLDLQRVHFLCGDFVEYLRANQTQFDVCIASGVLYHMRNPVELIELLAKISDRVFIWTHYYDPAIIVANPELAGRFSGSISGEHAGFRATLFRQEYQDALGWAGFCGAGRPYSYWMTRDDILACLRFFGLDDIRISFDHPQHFHGPAFAVAALRSRAKQNSWRILGQAPGGSAVYVPEPRKSFHQLMNEAVFHYRRGGLRTLIPETAALLRRRFKRKV